MGLQTGGYQGRAIESQREVVDNPDRVEKAGSSQGGGDYLSTEIERLKEKYSIEPTERGPGGGLTGLGIRVNSNHRSKSFLSFGDDDDDEDDEDDSRGDGARIALYARRQPSLTSIDNSDAVSITSTCPDLDLTPLVNAFPSPPTPTSCASPSAFSLEVHRPILQHRPSISTISSELTLASSTSSLETPSPQTPTAAEMVPLGIVVPRPNAASLRRVRSFAKPVSVYFSPDRPPALPLPSLPLVGTTPPTPTTPSLVIPSFENSSLSSSSTTLPSNSDSSSAQSVVQPSQAPYGFYTPSYGRNPRNPAQPPTAPPPDRPLPSIPASAVVAQCRRDTRMVEFPTKQLPLPPPLATPTVSSTPPPPSRHSIRELSLPILPPKDEESHNDRPRTNSTDSDSSATPTIKTPSTSGSSGPFAGPIQSSRSRKPSTTQSRQPRTRVESNSSIASLDVSQISLQLNQLASHGTTVTSSDPPTVIPEIATTAQNEEEEEVVPQTEREVDRERVRRLISRVSSVIEMRKMSTASLASSNGTPSTTNSLIGNSPAERNGYKAYKLTKKPSLSPSNSFASFAGGSSPFRPNLGAAGNRSRTSSYDSDSESSASEEMFDLSFDTSSSSSSHRLLSPSSFSSPSNASSSSATLSSSYLRRSQIPPRWAGRRRSSATTIDEDEAGEDRLKKSATRRADELFDRNQAVYENEEEELDEVREDLQHERSTRRNLRTVASNDSFGQSRLEQPKTTVSTRTLRTVSSVPLLRGSSHPRATFTRPTTYTSSPLGSRSPQTTTTTRLKPLITSSPPHTRRSFLPSPSTSSRIPMSGFSRNSSQVPQFSDPFASPSLNHRSSASNLRKSSLPVPSTTISPQLSPTSLRRPSYPAFYSNSAEPHRRKSSLAALSYNHSSPLPLQTSPELGRAVSPTNRSIGKPSPSRITQPSFTSSRQR